MADHTNNHKPLNTYVFTYFGYVPIYNDFDQEWVTIEAKNYADAVNKLNKNNIFALSMTLESINGVKFTVECD